VVYCVNISDLLRQYYAIYSVNITRSTASILHDLLRQYYVIYCVNITWSIASIYTIRSAAEAKVSTWWRPKGVGR